MTHPWISFAQKYFSSFWIFTWKHQMFLYILLSMANIVRKVKLILSSLQFMSLGRQCNQSSWVAPVITNKDPGKSGNLIKLGGPFFFLNSKTLTAPRDTEATDGFRPNWGWTSECQPHISCPMGKNFREIKKHTKKELNIIRQNNDAKFTMSIQIGETRIEIGSCHAN